MKQDDIIRMAREAGFRKPEAGSLSGNSDEDELFYIGEYACGEESRLVTMSYAAGAAEEREACEKICEDMAASAALSDIERYRALFIRDQIRARGQS